jgi:uncharacterized repeat protein (TIGR02543 family)
MTVTEGAIAESLSVTAAASNGEAVSYQWHEAVWDDTFDEWNGGLEIPSATGSSYSIPADLTAGKYAYFVTLSANGCADVSTKYISVTVNPPGGVATHAVNFSVTGGTGGGTLTATVDGGTISTGTSVQQGKNVVFTADPSDGYQIKVWTDNNSPVNGTVTTYTLSNLAAAHAVTVEFEQIPTYLVTVTDGTGTGNYAAGATVNITANEPQSGKAFDKWTTSDGVMFANATSASTTFTMPAKAVTVTATYKDLPTGEYSITVLNDGGGTANANVNAAQQGATVTLTAEPNNGYRFKEWEITGDTITLSGASVNPATFTMPAENVTVKAIFEPNPVTTYTVTFMSDGTVHATKIVTAPATTIDALPSNPTNGNYTFSGWYTAANGGGTRFLATSTVSSSLTVYAYWTSNSSGGGGYSGGGGGSSYTPPATAPVTTTKQPDMPTIAKQNVSGTVTNGTLSVTVTETMAKNAINAATDKTDGFALRFDLTATASGYDNVSATINRAALTAMQTAGAEYVQIGSAVLDITLDLKTINTVLTQTTGNVTVTAVSQDKLSSAAQALIGRRPVYDITVKGANGVTVSDLNGGTVTIGLAYTPTTAERTGNLYGVYVDASGRPQLLTNSSYTDGRVIFERTSLSVYGVAYKTPAPAFTDITGHWAKDNIDFAASRNLISGTAATLFSPNTNITRADFLMALGKLSGADVSGYRASSFSDVPNTNPAMPYIEWAAQNKIVAGIGGGKFGPDTAITREAMAVMMVNYAKVTAYTLPVARQAAPFADGANISAWAKAAVTAIQQTGVIVGKTGNRFDPQGNMTRGEAATVLRRFTELVIDEGTARGWVQNDSGEWQYIDAYGKARTGWLSTTGGSKYWLDDKGVMVSGKWVQISGKWYYFQADGKLAVNTTIDGYPVGPDGARKED